MATISPEGSLPMETQAESGGEMARAGAL
eukprot:SAG11_NODE_24538_length_372_cov_0.468864_2_plen_28_part_01